VMPYEGRYDALQPTAFTIDKDLSIGASGNLLPEISGEIRDIKWINYGGVPTLVLAFNNKGLTFIRPKAKSNEF